MEKINKKALIFSLFLALICALLVYRYVSSLSKPASVEQKQDILIAARDIYPGEEITAEDIVAREVSQDAVRSESLNSIEDIKGMYVRDIILSGEQFSAERVAKKEEMSLAYSIPAGKRAVCIFVDENNIFSSLIEIGDFVDVIVNFSKDEEEHKYKRVTGTIVENAEVLALGGLRYRRDGKADNEGKPPATMTLAVAPLDAEALFFSAGFGDINIALRSKGDIRTNDTDGVIFEDIAPVKSIYSEDTADEEE